MRVSQKQLACFAGLVSGSPERTGSWDSWGFSRTGRAPGRNSGFLPKDGMGGFSSFFGTGMGPGEPLDPSAQGVNTGV